MKKIFGVLGIALITLLLVSGCTQQASPTTQPPAGQPPAGQPSAQPGQPSGQPVGQQGTVSIRTSAELGQFLVDAQGMTLYYYKQDAPGTGVSGCVGPCLQRWPPFMSETVVAPAGLNQGDFSTISRPEGKQVTYKGQPLYYYYLDEEPGDTNGQNIQQIWFVVKP